MRIIVVGSGLIGLTSARALARFGHEVVVMDRSDGPGFETSFANGSLLTPSMSDPWNAPGCWRTLLRSIGRSDAALQLRLKALPSLGTWGLRFLWNSRRRAFHRNTLANLRLALQSLAAMDSLRSEVNIEYGRQVGGTLRIFRDEDSLAHAMSAARLLHEQGIAHRRLTRDETVGLEPGLAPIALGLAGGIHYPIDEAGDAYGFCKGLAADISKLGAEFRYRTHVRGLEVENGRVVAVLTDWERLPAEAVVIAAGSYSAPLLRSAGLSLPVRPVKGYSLTLDAPHVPLSHPVIDDALHAVIVPMTGAVRAAGTAEFAGFDRRIDRTRVSTLSTFIKSVLPQAPLDFRTGRPWSGLRAMSADGVPIIGETRIPGLWVNSGHGHLGWTMAAGSARLLSDLIDKRKPSLDAVPYAPARFSC